MLQHHLKGVFRIMLLPSLIAIQVWGPLIPLADRKLVIRLLHLEWALEVVVRQILSVNLTSVAMPPKLHPTRHQHSTRSVKVHRISQLHSRIKLLISSTP